MSAERLHRRLTAILSADVKGYSRLMGEDEEATVRTLTDYRKVISDLVDGHGGRVVDSPGDNILAEFPSAVDSVLCAARVQEELRARNEALDENRRIEFRIGINIGDVVADGDRIYGDGVNIAARLEGLADAGGICVSGTAYDQIEKKVPFTFEFLGEKSVKNIKKPVRTYRVLTDPASAPREYEEVRPPEERSIAVLPFVNMSGDPAQEYFSDGITEEIITGLAKTPKLFVIARNSSFAYKGKAEKIQTIARELGVRYLLEGSIRKAGDRVRITAQLIDGLSGHHLWAERYDRDLKDIFAVQDEITINIMRNMQVKLTEGEQACHWLRHGSANLDAYEKSMRGMALFRRFSPDGNQQARKLFQEAAALDPNCPAPYVMQGWSHLLDVINGWAGSPGKSMERAGESAGKALEIDESEPETHALLGNIHLLMREYDTAVEEGERAVRLNPNGADAYVWLAMILIAVGRSDDAVMQMQMALRLNPLPPNWYYWTLGNAYFWTKRYDKSLEEYQKALENSPDFLGAKLGILGAYQLLGRKGDVEATVAEILRIFPQFSLEHFAATMIFKNPEDVDFLMKTLRQAGLQ